MQLKANQARQSQTKTMEKEAMAGARKTMEATPKKPMFIQPKPIATQSNAVETDPQKDDETTKETMGGGRRSM